MYATPAVTSAEQFLSFIYSTILSDRICIELIRRHALRRSVGNEARHLRVVVARLSVHLFAGMQ